MANEKRLIDANALRKKATLRHGYDFQGIFVKVQDIDDAPTVDAVEVVHGRWEKAPHQYGFLRCSKCNDVYISDTWLCDGKWNYCPNCGAKMDGDGNA